MVQVYSPPLSVCNCLNLQQNKFSTKLLNSIKVTSNFSCKGKNHAKVREVINENHLEFVATY